MAQYNVIVTVVDPNGVKHYAHMPDPSEKSHPGLGGLWTIGCSQVASKWESGDKMEELYQLVQNMQSTGNRMKELLVYSTGRLIAGVIERFATELLPNLNYHRSVCSMCNEALLDDSSVGQ